MAHSLGGLGEAAARALARMGWDVVLSGRQRDRLVRIVEEINQWSAVNRSEEANRHSGRALAISADVSSEKDQKRLFKGADCRLCRFEL